MRRLARLARSACLVAAALPPMAPAAGPPPSRSGFDDMGASTQALQRDDSLNPGLLWVADGQALWRTAPAGGAPSCQGCHGELATSMRGVAARHPAFDAETGGPIDLGRRIDRCRVRHQQQPVWAPESAPRLALEAALGHASRGLPLAPPDDPRLAPARARGEALFRRRIGQLDLSCAQCHDDLAGRSLGGTRIPQGQVNGYPSYRLEWQGLGSLERRLRNCLTGVRAEGLPFGDAALLDLATWLAWRSRGLAVETPAVRP
jgi:sulfur-oxidizing protein SoxA